MRKPMRQRDNTGVDIGPGLPDHLKFLVDVPPVPSGAHDKCSGSGRCQTMFIGGVTCGALFSKCALHPMESKATAEVKVGAADGGTFSAFVSGLKARHPELFSAAADPRPPAPAPNIRARQEIVPDRISLSAGDDWAEEVSVSGESEVGE